ncbi:MAG: DUF6498-containing protein [Planctomycetota bacterium]|jgi:hypothetical protein
MPENLESERKITSLPLIVLVLVNLIPVVGVLFFGWDVFVIVGLYWAETIIVGFYALLKFVFAPTRIVSIRKKLIGTPLFLLFFGWFISGFGVCIIFFFVVFPSEFLKDPTLTLPMPENDLFKVHWPGPLALYQLGIESGRIMYYTMPKRAILVVFCLIVSHGLSFIINYILKEGRNHPNFRIHTADPGVRILILHISLMIGGFLILIFKPHVTILVCMVILKCLIDAKLYLSQQKKVKIKVSNTNILNGLKDAKY